MRERYFATARKEVLPYLPEGPLRILELGCGAGSTINLIRQNRQVDWAGGLELDDEAAVAAEKTLDKVWHVNVETYPVENEIEAGSVNLILCLDVLEHLVDPWSVVKRISPLLAPGGRLIISLPNIRNWKFIRRLLFKGDFHYQDAGLLDRTHLRFFVRDTAIELAECGGLNLAVCADARQYKPFEFRKLLLAATFGGLTDLIAKQYIVVAERR